MARAVRNVITELQKGNTQVSIGNSAQYIFMPVDAEILTQPGISLK